MAIPAVVLSPYAYALIIIIILQECEPQEEADSEFDVNCLVHVGKGIEEKEKEGRFENGDPFPPFSFFLRFF